MGSQAEGFTARADLLCVIRFPKTNYVFWARKNNPFRVPGRGCVILFNFRLARCDYTYRGTNYLEAFTST